MPTAEQPLADLWPLLAIGALILVAWLRDVLRARRERRNAARGPYLVFPVESRGPGAPRITPMPIAPPPQVPPAANGHAPAPVASPAPLDDPASRTIRMDPTLEGTIQLLPGWLEVVRGTSAGHEIRFVRIGGEENPEITLGRAEGPEYRHIRLPEGTVSRLHAKLQYRDRAWRIANLSRTNPVRINGRMLFDGAEDAVLGDGDRIELGEVELRFRDGPR